MLNFFVKRPAAFSKDFFVCVYRCTFGAFVVRDFFATERVNSQPKIASSLKMQRFQPKSKLNGG